MSADRRASERLPILGSLPGEVTISAPMAVMDIGAGGLTIETSFPLHLGSVHHLKLSLGATTLVATARVTHSRLTDVERDIVTYRTGLEWVEPSDGVRAAIDEYLGSVKKGRAGG